MLTQIKTVRGSRCPEDRPTLRVLDACRCARSGHSLRPVLLLTAALLNLFRSPAREEPRRPEHSSHGLPGPKLVALCALLAACWAAPLSPALRPREIAGPRNLNRPFVFFESQRLPRGGVGKTTAIFTTTSNFGGQRRLSTDDLSAAVPADSSEARSEDSVASLIKSLGGSLQEKRRLDDSSEESSEEEDEGPSSASAPTPAQKSSVVIQDQVDSTGSSVASGGASTSITAKDVSSDFKASEISASNSGDISVPGVQTSSITLTFLNGKHAEPSGSDKPQAADGGAEYTQLANGPAQETQPGMQSSVCPKVMSAQVESSALEPKGHLNSLTAEHLQFFPNQLPQHTISPTPPPTSTTPEVAHLATSGQPQGPAFTNPQGSQPHTRIFFSPPSQNPKGQQQPLAAPPYFVSFRHDYVNPNKPTFPQGQVSYTTKQKVPAEVLLPHILSQEAAANEHAPGGDKGPQNRVRPQQPSPPSNSGPQANQQVFAPPSYNPGFSPHFSLAPGYKGPVTTIILNPDLSSPYQFGSYVPRSESSDQKREGLYKVKSFVPSVTATVPGSPAYTATSFVPDRQTYSQGGKVFKVTSFVPRGSRPVQGGFRQAVQPIPNGQRSFPSAPGRTVYRVAPVGSRRPQPVQRLQDLHVTVIGPGGQLRGPQQRVFNVARFAPQARAASARQGLQPAGSAQSRFPPFRGRPQQAIVEVRAVPIHFQQRPNGHRVTPSFHEQPLTFYDVPQRHSAGGPALRPSVASANGPGFPNGRARFQPVQVPLAAVVPQLEPLGRFPSDGGAGSAGPLLGARYVPVVNLENPPTSGRRPGRDHRRKNERSLDLSSGASDWDDPGKYFSGAARTFARRLWPAIQELAADDAISTQCASSLLLLYAGVRRYQQWALHFVDASGRLPSGLLGGVAWDPGEYDQCLSIAAVLEGSYCTVRWNISRTAFVSRLATSRPPGGARQHEPFNNIRLGLCVPSLCSTSHIQAVVDKVLQRQNASAVVLSCHSRNDFSVSHVQLFLVCLLCIWVTLIASSTLMHLLWNLKKAWPKDTKPTFFVRLVVAVSAVTSLTRLVAIDRSKHYSKTVDALKVISVLWIVLGITYQSKLPRVSGSAFDVKGWGGSALYSVTTSSNLGFTTAFLLSGFLVAPSLPPLRSLNGSIPKRLATSLGERYIRLTVPALFVLVVFWLLPLSVDGPLAEELLRPKLDACRRRWWTVPLHVNNLRGGDQV
ncbi:hypothetical protein HPB47_010198, partial [Ixodes persulcatus]